MAFADSFLPCDTIKQNNLFVHLDTMCEFDSLKTIDTNDPTDSFCSFDTISPRFIIIE